MTSLFESDAFSRSKEQLEEGAALLRGFASVDELLLIEEAERIAQAAAFRHLVVPGTGHLAHRDAPEAYRAVVEEWVTHIPRG